MKIAVLAGDGIGPEVTAQAARVVRAVAGNRLALEMEAAPIGQAGVDAAGAPLPKETLALAKSADAILFGAVGGAGDERAGHALRPGEGLLTLRKSLGLFANYRPAVLFDELVGASTLRPEVVRGTDMLILRELTGDLYFGEPRGIYMEDGERMGLNTMRYTESEIARIAHAGFRAARARRGKLCSVDKANVLETMSLWRQVVTEVGADYPDVALSHMFVDAACMQLIRDPRQFDVIVAGNMFGDILSDAAAMLTGSIGMLPSASIGAGSKGLYEPVHGSAPDIAGQDVANPLGAILSAAMMLRHSLDLPEEAARVEAAVRRVLAEGWRTADIFEAGKRKVGTAAMGDAVVAALG